MLREVENLCYDLCYSGAETCTYSGFFSSSVIAAELMQYRRPVGGGPSLKTWPRWAPQRRQVTSVRTPKPGVLANEWSACSAIAFPFTPSTGAKKLGQPHPL